MIDTLIKIGQYINEKQNEWDMIILDPKPKYTMSNGQAIENRVLGILFDLNDNKIIIEKENLNAYSMSSPKDFLLIKTQRGNSGKTYIATVFPKKMEDLKIAVFGKMESDDGKGDLVKDIENKFPALMDTLFYRTLLKMFDLIKYAFELDSANIKKKISPSRNQRIVFCYLSVKSDELNILQATPLAKIKGCEEYYRKKFIQQKTVSEEVEERLCYATGVTRKNIFPANFTRGDNLNNLFIKTAKNYLQDFEEKKLGNNYQIDNTSKEYLEAASSYLLKNYSVSIANIRHCIVPRLQFTSQINFELAFSTINQEKDLLFGLKELDELALNIESASNVNELLGLNFLAIDTAGGQSFKIFHQIQDVSQFHFQRVIEAFADVDWEMKELPKVKWDEIMLVNEKRYRFNLAAMYWIIPIRDSTKSKNNLALELFKNILENRRVNYDLIFRSFCLLMNCYKSGQFDEKRKHRKFSNIREYSNFDFAIRNSVYKYFAFINVLKKLKLVDMNNKDQGISDDAPIRKDNEQIQREIEDFFIKMDYSFAQKSLFFLGQALSIVASAQYNKKHTNKPILKKINYEGMDRDKIFRLESELREKLQQYKILNKGEISLNKFHLLFDYNHWKMSNKEAVFFILSGYSYNVHL